MVSALPLERGPAIERDLDRLCQLKPLRAVRRIIQSQPDPDFCIHPDFIAGLRLLAPRDLAFDICVLHHHLPNVIKMVRQCPELRFVLDHIGKPPIKAGGPIEPWLRDIRELAALGNVHCKISGVVTEADHQAWTRDQIRPYIERIIEAFGFGRIMFGGDWHVLELAGTYARLDRHRRRYHPWSRRAGPPQALPRKCDRLLSSAEMREIDGCCLA